MARRKNKRDIYGLILLFVSVFMYATLWFSIRYGEDPNTTTDDRNRLLLFSTIYLIVMNLVALIVLLVVRKRIYAGPSLFVIVLFGMLHAQLNAYAPERHYTFDDPPNALSWAEFTGAHLVRAVDILDSLEEYHIDLQDIRHSSATAGTVLVIFHIFTAIFVLSLAVRWVMKWIRSWLPEPENLTARRESAERLERRLRSIQRIAIVICIVLVIACAYSQQWATADWVLWPIDNALRTIDFGDAMQIFHWRLHGIEMGYATIALALLFRFVIGLYIVQIINHYRVRYLRVLDFKTVDDLVDDLHSHDAQVRSFALESLRRIQQIPGTAVVPLITMIAEDESATGETAAKLLTQTTKAPDNAVPALTEFLQQPRFNIREFAAEELHRIGPPAASASMELLRCLGEAQPKPSPIAIPEIPTDSDVTGLEEMSEDDNEAMIHFEDWDTAEPMEAPTPNLVIDDSELASDDDEFDDLHSPWKQTVYYRAIRRMSVDEMSTVVILDQGLQHENPKVRRAAMLFVLESTFRVEESLAHELLLIADPVPEVSATAQDVFLRMKKLPPSLNYIQILAKHLHHPDATVCFVSLKLMARLRFALGSARSEIEHESDATLLDGPTNDEIEQTRLLSILRQTFFEAWPHLRSHRTPAIQLEALQLLGKMGTLHPTFVPDLIAFTQDPAPLIRQEAIQLLAESAAVTKEAIPSLIPRLIDRNEAVRDATSSALIRMGCPLQKSRGQLVDLLGHSNPIVQIAAMDKLSELGEHAIPALFLMLEVLHRFMPMAGNQRGGQRCERVMAILRRLGEPGHVEVEKIAKDRSNTDSIRKAADYALAQWS